MALTHPQFDPVALDLGFLQVHWYGLMYLLAFLSAYLLATFWGKKRGDFTGEMVSDLIFFGAMGVILGGRIGYVILYNFGEFLANPAYLFKVWEGGMSFHGGFMGVLVAMWFFGRKYKKHAFTVLDFVAPCVPLGLLFGRLGNFINGELWGRVSQGDYGHLMYFPQAVHADHELINADPSLHEIAVQMGEYYLLPRHPSQLYQAFTEGVLLFILLWWFSAKPRPRYAVSALFLLGYGCSRFITEFFRQPDVGYELIFGWMSKGQLYSLPMIIAGVVLMALAQKRQIYDWQKS
ncbi:Prolipoprotein diacylglyceryl transferase [Moraxella lacunata]|uniref:Phosphatidylglycerol--prolipoprotein diacylglyceryl transferase n=1 Tax=Moraxella lacunata TaxID=477 RepID=A0A1V4GZP7_MORLA|nr:prolipoprotein diacylglyceryl transferase [Moraxella lacunata]OPH37940.1 prolipoprotein diacylglyceryl transferase [Moraxella lacunata]STZ00296.1 Prolipoprotein diacylglyceryl transferase [Moraxella lacunata]